MRAWCAYLDNKATHEDSLAENLFISQCVICDDNPGCTAFATVVKEVKKPGDAGMVRISKNFSLFFRVKTHSQHHYYDIKHQQVLYVLCHFTVTSGQQSHLDAILTWLWAF